MPFTAEERRRISEVLRERGVPETCPLCQREKLRLPDNIVFLTVHEPHVPFGNIGTAPFFPKAYMPCVILVCENCGSIYLLNLKLLGLWDELSLEEAREEAIR